MSIRVYACPWIGDGQTVQTGYRSKMMQYSNRSASFFPSNADGSPASTWILTVAFLNDWSAVEADPTMLDIFSGDLPNSITSRTTLLSFLRSHTIADVPIARRTEIQATLDTLGVNRADFTGSTLLWKVFQRLVSSVIENDFNWGTHFRIDN